MRYRYMQFPGGVSKAVTLSYDDGVTQDKRFSDVITSHGLKCTFNLNGEGCHGSNRLSSDDVREYILSRGHEIAIHGINHRAPGRIRTIEGIRDALDCRLYLEREYGVIIRGMAYPDSGITSPFLSTTYESVEQYLCELDVTYARTLGGDNDRFEMPQDFYAWMPTAHHNNPKIFEYIEKFVNYDPNEQFPARRLPKLFYMWGHSYEFDDRDNWDRLEAICKELSGKDDVWYATNGEIYEYTKAYESLVYSADSTIIYNPTLFEIFFTVDGEDYSIKPGETLKL